MEMLVLNSKVLWPKLSAHFPPIPQLCPLIKEGQVWEDCVCARHGFTVLQLSKRTLLFHPSFSSAIKPPCVSNQQPNKLPGSLLRVWVCVWQKKGHRETQENSNEREMCLQGFWHLTPNESHFCCFVQRCLRQACFGSSTGQHLCNDQIHWKAPMIVTRIFSKISTSCSLGIKIHYWNSQLLMLLLSSMALRS